MHRRVCRFFCSEIGCLRGGTCEYFHPNIIFFSEDNKSVSYSESEGEPIEDKSQKEVPKYPQSKDNFDWDALEYWAKKL